MTFAISPVTTAFTLFATYSEDSNRSEAFESLPRKKPLKALHSSLVAHFSFGSQLFLCAIESIQSVKIRIAYLISLKLNKSF